MPTGRFAPSPSGRLHLGNLRTALVAWLAARIDDSPFYLRFEDLGARQLEHYESQLTDLTRFGLDFDGEPIRQLDRLDSYRDAVSDLQEHGLVYECFCSRSEIRRAASAPHDTFAGYSYPGTCRELTMAQRRSKIASGRSPALRIFANGTKIPFVDQVAGYQEFEVDDFVVQRNDGVPAYHLVVVVDDAAQGVEQVVRANDLLESTARHLFIYRTLGLEPPSHAHVPLVLSPSRERLAKRHGAVTLDDQEAMGRSPEQVLSYLGWTLGLCDAGDAVAARDLLTGFELSRTPTDPVVLPVEMV